MNRASRTTRLIGGTLGALLLTTVSGPPAAAAPVGPPAPAPGAAPGPGAGTGEAEPAPDPVRPGPGLQTFDLAPVTGASPTGRSLGAPGTARSEAAAGARAVPARDTRPFALVGATWADPEARLTGTVEIRTRSVATGAWTAWRTLESDGLSPADEDSPDAAGRGRTDPFWVGTSDAVQARVAASGGTPPLPAGLRLDLVNPDQPQTPPPAARPESGPSARPASAAGRPGGTVAARQGGGPVAARVAVPPRPAPRVVTRAGWGADERLVREAPEYSSSVQVVFVHHTAGTNAYSCRDSARIIRGIQLYHVRSNGWNDIGYNFLVDRCGNLFEGRRGGVDRAVLGAHTLGFNAYSSAVAVLGDYRGRGVSNAVKGVIAQVSAYKLGSVAKLATARTKLRSSGSDRYPEGTVATLFRVSGHRDTGRTECPGNGLYGQLASIRAVAGAGPAGLRLVRVTGAVKVGSTLYTRGLITPLWTTSTPSTMLHRFDVYVDGRLAVSARNSHRRTSLRLSPGPHTVQIRAIHMSGRSASFAYPVYADATLPRFTAGPSLVLRRGPLNGTVPVRLGWSAADAGGLRSMTLVRPRRLALSPAATGLNTAVAPARPVTFTLRAADRTGNLRDASVTRTPMVLSETVAARTGSWAPLRDRAYLSGTALRSRTPGSALTWTFSGRSAALAASPTAGSGTVTIYVDGRRVGTVSLRAPSTRHRQAVWAINGSAAGRHTVRVVANGGAILDGLVVLR